MKNQDALESLIDAMAAMKDEDLATSNEQMRLSNIAYKIMNLQQQISRLKSLVIGHPYSPEREGIAAGLDDNIESLLKLYDIVQKRYEERGFNRDAELTEIQNNILLIVNIVADNIKQLLSEYIEARGG